MKQILILSIFLFYSYSYSQTARGCASSNWPSEVSSTLPSEFVASPGPGSDWTYKWVVSGNLTIVNSDPLSNRADIRGTSPNGQGTVYVARYKNGEMACSDKKTVNVLGSCVIPCNNVSFNIGTQNCSQDIPVGIPYNTRIYAAFANSRNPFNNPALVEFKWNPSYEGQMHMTNLGIVGACAINVGGYSEFFVNFVPNPPNNIHILPMILRFTDQVTREVCTKTFKLEFNVQDCGSGNPN